MFDERAVVKAIDDLRAVLGEGIAGPHEHVSVLEKDLSALLAVLERAVARRNAPLAVALCDATKMLILERVDGKV